MDITIFLAIAALPLFWVVYKKIKKDPEKIFRVAEEKGKIHRISRKTREAAARDMMSLLRFGGYFIFVVVCMSLFAFL
ncbi:hypothetical protein L0Y49_04670 [bacterium]|nr:hypothetical protein [bacterium]MCI0566516.1 hypothetical protein [bacterium]MCI0680362.1 hypothetical protein [bacterium]